MAIITIDTDICFECGKPKEEMHHIIPRVRGGTKTIPLCIECHCKVHGVKNRPDHKRLTIEGLQKAKARGVKLGKPENFTNETRKKGSSATNKKFESLNEEVTKIIISFRELSYSYEKIANYLTENGYMTYNDKNFTKSTTHRLYQRYLTNK